MAQKLPAFHFYPGDWFKDPGIMALNSQERGAWFQMLLLMFESPRRGFLELGARPYPIKKMAKIFSISEQKLKKIQQKLIDFGIVSVEKDTQILFNRRMIRDEEIRIAQSNGGVKGYKEKKKRQGVPSQKKKGPSEDEDESESEDKKVLNKSMKEAAFELRWLRYRGEKDARKRATGYWNTSVKTQSDLDEYDQAEINYYKIVEASTFARSFKGGATWMNNWRDYINQKPPDQPTGGRPPSRAEQKRGVADEWLEEGEANDQARISQGNKSLP